MIGELKRKVLLNSELGYSTYDIIKDAEENILDKLVLVKKKQKPTLPNNHSTQDVENYLIKLKEWESDTTDYEKLRLLYWEQRQELVDIIELFIKKESGFDDIPDKYKEKVWYKAHSSYEDYNALYEKLEELVDIFN